eukprot:6213532-Pleurochrysis_carterae.AAC.4
MDHPFSRMDGSPHGVQHILKKIMEWLCTNRNSHSYASHIYLCAATCRFGAGRWEPRTRPSREPSGA